MNDYLNRHFSGNYCQAVINAIQESYEDTDTLIDYISNISLDNASDYDLDNLGLIVGYPRPVMPLPYASTTGYLDTPTYIALLKQIAIIKYNGFSFSALDTLVYFLLAENGASNNYTFLFSSNGKSSPNADIIINLWGVIDEKWIYILETVLDVFLMQGIVVHVVNNPFVFALWNGSAWADNPAGKGFSRLILNDLLLDSGNKLELLNGNYVSIVGNEADKLHGGKFYPVI